jgi:hypothetical protein
MRHFVLTTLIILLSLNFFGQTKDTLRPVVRKFAVLPSPLGYIWQGSHNFDFGLQPMILLNAKNYHNNIGLVIAGNIAVINKATYFTPTTKLKLYKELSSRKMAWEVSVGYSYTNIQSQLDSRITPEAGISYRGFHLTYGYNIPLSNYTDNYTNSNRIALRFWGW